MSTKENYTEDQTVALVEAYNAAENQEQRDAVVAEQAENLGKTLPSIRAKLVREGVYIAKAYKTKNGASPESKANIVSTIAGLLSASEESVESLEKANKATLRMIRDALNAQAQA